MSGCGVADETMLSMAQLLTRNRKAKGSEMQAGPFDATIDRGLGGGPITRGLSGAAVARAIPDERIASSDMDAGFAADPEVTLTGLYSGLPPGVAVSAHKT